MLQKKIWGQSNEAQLVFRKETVAQASQGMENNKHLTTSMKDSEVRLVKGQDLYLNLKI